MPKEYSTSEEVTEEWLKNLENLRQQGGGVTGVPSGITALDRVTAGWQNSDLIVLAGRTAMGKTGLAHSIILNAALDYHKSVLLFTPRMSKKIVLDRMMSGICEIEGEKLKKGQLADWEWEKLYEKKDLIAQANITINDYPRLYIERLIALSRDLHASKGLDLIVIDDLQFIQIRKSYIGVGNREQELAFIIKQLKILAREIDIPIIVLSELNRSVEVRGGDKRPLLFDLRDSGTIEDFTDMVLFLYRAEYYGLYEDAAGNSTAGIAEIIIAKHTNGSLADIPVFYKSKYCKFSDLLTDRFELANLPPFPSNTSTKEVTLGSKVNAPDFDTTASLPRSIRPYITLVLMPGKSEEMPTYPSKWDEDIGQQVSLIDTEGGRIPISWEVHVDEDVNGVVEKYSRLDIKEGYEPEALKLGTIIEIKGDDGQLKIYRKEQSSLWVYLGGDLKTLIDKSNEYVKENLLIDDQMIRIYEYEKEMLVAQGFKLHDHLFEVIPDEEPSTGNVDIPPLANPDDEPPF